MSVICICPAFLRFWQTHEVWFVQQGGHRAASKSRIGDNREGSCSVCPDWRWSETQEPHLRLSTVHGVPSQ